MHAAAGGQSGGPQQTSSHSKDPPTVQAPICQSSNQWLTRRLAGIQVAGCRGGSARHAAAQQPWLASAPHGSQLGRAAKHTRLCGCCARLLLLLPLLCRCCGFAGAGCQGGRVEQVRGAAPAADCHPAGIWRKGNAADGSRRDATVQAVEPNCLACCAARAAQPAARRALLAYRRARQGSRRQDAEHVDAVPCCGRCGQQTAAGAELQGGQRGGVGPKVRQHQPGGGVPHNHCARHCRVGLRCSGGW